MSFVRELGDGWREFRSRTWIWVVVLGFAFANAAESAGLNILGPVVAKESLGGASVWGLVLAAMGVGLVLGGLLALRIRPERPLFVGVVSITLLVPPLVLLAIEAPWPVIAASALLAGIGVELFSVFWDTSLQTHVPNEVLSRVSAWDAIGSLVLIPAAYAIVGPLADAIGIETDALALRRHRVRGDHRAAPLARRARAAAARLRRTRRGLSFARRWIARRASPWRRTGASTPRRSSSAASRSCVRTRRRSARC